MVYHRILNIIPCAIQLDLVVYSEKKIFSEKKQALFLKMYLGQIKCYIPRYRDKCKRRAVSGKSTLVPRYCPFQESMRRKHLAVIQTMVVCLLYDFSKGRRLCLNRLWVNQELWT